MSKLYKYRTMCNMRIHKSRQPRVTVNSWQATRFLTTNWNKVNFEHTTRHFKSLLSNLFDAARDKQEY